MNAPQKLPAQIVGNAGMYYVCYELSLRGWNVMPTARNAKGIDIVAYNVTGKKMIGIQTKALSARNAARVGASLDMVMGDYWVIVNNLTNEKRAVFILTHEEVKQSAKQDEKGERCYWLDPPKYDVPEFKDAWDKIGRGDNNEVPHS